MDVESYERWYDYSRARDMMFEHTDTEDAPWHIVHSDDKKRARLNVIAHILSQIPYKKIDRDKGQAAGAVGQEEVRRSGIDRRPAPGGATILS